MNRNFLIIVVALIAISAIGASAFAQDATWEVDVNWAANGESDNPALTMVVYIWDDLDVLLEEVEMDLLDVVEEGMISRWVLVLEFPAGANSWEIRMNDPGGHSFNRTISYGVGIPIDGQNLAPDDFIHGG